MSAATFSGSFKLHQSCSLTVVNFGRHADITYVCIEPSGDIHAQGRLSARQCGSHSARRPWLHLDRHRGMARTQSKSGRELFCTGVVIVYKI